MTVGVLTVQAGRKNAPAAARSLVYRSLSEAFDYPTEERWTALDSGDWPTAIAAVAEHLPWVPSFEDSEVPPLAELQQAYVSLFEVGVGRPFCPLYEGSHRNGRLKLMEDLVRFYEYFGIRTLPGDHPDHLCAELDFMHYLAFKEAAAEERDDSTADLRRAQRDFLDRHLCRWLPRLRTRLGRDSEIRRPREVPAVYMELAAFAEAFCRADMEHLRIGGGNPHENVGRRPD
jgi:DMSO reductase family type II enzyme chaperone